MAGPPHSAPPSKPGKTTVWLPTESGTNWPSLLEGAELVEGPGVCFGSAIGEHVFRQALAGEGCGRVGRGLGGRGDFAGDGAGG